MKKIILTLWCSLGIVSFTQATVFKWGPRFAIAYSKLPLQTLGKNLQFDALVGYQAGLVTRVQLPLIYVQPEFLITYTGSNYTQGNQAMQLRYTQVTLPCMVGITFLDFVRVAVGPNFSLLWSARETALSTNQTTQVKQGYMPWSLSYQVGIGIDLWRFILDLKYEFSLTTPGSLKGITTNHNTPIWILSLGYHLL